MNIFIGSLVALAGIIKTKTPKKKHKQTHKQTRTRNTCTDKMYTTHELKHLKNKIKLQ